MSLSSKEYFVREAFLSVKRNRLMSVASISTVAISLLILGFFTVMIINMNNMANILESQVQVTAYVKSDTDKEDLDNLNNQIKNINGVTKVEFIGKDVALQRFTERLGEQKELLSSLGDTNPLPDSFEIHVDKPDSVKQIAGQIDKFEQVEETRFGKEVVEQLFSLTRIVRYGGVVLIIFLAFAALFIISNTIRITVFSRRKEVSIMKYVGATDSFIRWPFFLEGMLLGMMGALIAVILLNWTYGIILDKVYAMLAFLPLVPRSPMLFYLSFVLIFLGMGIGALGSSISLRKFLKA